MGKVRREEQIVEIRLRQIKRCHYLSQTINTARSRQTTRLHAAEIATIDSEFASKFPEAVTGPQAIELEQRPETRIHQLSSEENESEESELKLSSELSELKLSEESELKESELSELKLSSDESSSEESSAASTLPE